MHSIEIRLEGEFYDSYIYAGRLYLWTIDRRIISIDWDSLIQSLEEPNQDVLPLDCAFLRSSLLYQSDIARIMRDAHVRSVILEKFNRLGKEPIDVPAARWADYVLHEQDNPFDFPHSDVAIYLKKLFVCGTEGVRRCKLKTAKSRRMLAKSPDQLTDRPCFDIAFWNRIIAMASGNDGAFQMNIGDESGWLGLSDEPEVLTSAHTRAVEWMYGSVFCSSDEGGVLMDFTPWRPEDNESRQLRGTLDADQLFEGGSSGRYTWGAKEKICSASQTSITVAKYSHYAEEDVGRVTELGQLTFGKQLESRPIRADSSYFGYVMETTGGLVILGSNGETQMIGGEPVNWRIFRTSTDYVNQLHVSWDKHLSILSFNDDYLVDQSTKMVGLSFSNASARRLPEFRKSPRPRALAPRPGYHLTKEVEA